MADKKISALTASATPLAGTEVLPIVQSGTTVKVSVANLTAGREIQTGNIVSTLSGKDRLVVAPQNAGSGALILTTNEAGNAYAPLLYDGLNAKFSYAGTEVVQTNANGIAPAAGKGIDFGANTHAPGMTSELLNDYEEGVWTPVPTASSGTITTVGAVSGSYIKVGNQVTIWATIEITNNGTGAGRLDVSGLPFTAGSARYAGVGWNQNTAEALSAYVNPSATTASVWKYNATYPLGSSDTIIFTVTYRV